jgi:hypothetical protein
MEIISHRGYWKTIEEKNSVGAFESSFSLNFGTETDFRDYNEEIVISHDIANSNSLSATNFFELFKKHNPSLSLALNIKADGLQKKLGILLKQFSIDNYFVFDMSVPDTIGYIESGIIFFSRQSEFEPQPAFYENCSGIWLDAFRDIWYNADLIKDHIKNRKRVAIVSSELHKRNHYRLWEYLKRNNVNTWNEVILCTDIPEEAFDFFNN